VTPKAGRRSASASTPRIAISSLRGQYQLEWHDPGMTTPGYATQTIDEGTSANYSGMIPQGRNTTAGQTLTATINPGPLGPRLAPGVTSGSVTLDYATGQLIQAEEDTTKIPVGTFQDKNPVGGVPWCALMTRDPPP
jgi:hypothetical protein